MFGKYIVVVFMYSAIFVGKSDQQIGTEEDFFKNQIKLVHNFEQELIGSNLTNSQKCTLCNLVVESMLTLRRLHVVDEIILKILKYMCLATGDKSERYCNNVTQLMADVVRYIIDNKPDLHSHRMCAIFLNSLHCNADAYNWTIDIPPKKPTAVKQPSTGESFKILHLSDIHYDPLYTPNSTSFCLEPLCCQRDQKRPIFPETACSYWSTYSRGDTPWYLIEEVMKQLKNETFDFVYYTGDIVSHRGWDTTIKKNSIAISKVYSFFKKNFKTAVFPVLGNHEIHPVNLWTPENVTDERFSNRWLYELAAEHFALLTNDKSVKNTTLKGGFYTVSPKPGFRVIALNNNFYFTNNLWLIYDDFDVYNQLKWLVQTLLQAEESGEKVHILMHVPSGHPNALPVFGREYSRIVERFSDTITGQFAGHSHKDQWQVYYTSSAPIQPIGAVFHGASITAWTFNNPSYKIFQLNFDYSLQDYEEWTFNLTLANSQPHEPLEWFKLYGFCQAYGVDSLHPTNVDKVLHKLTTNTSLIQKYNTYRSRNSDHFIKIPCDKVCERQILCEISTTAWGETRHCDRFLSMMQPDGLGNVLWTMWQKAFQTIFFLLY